MQVQHAFPTLQARNLFRLKSNALSCVEGNAVKDLTKVQGNEIVSKLEYIIYYPRNQKDGIAFMFHTATYEVFISSI